jgi:hypothetical protein
MVETVLRWGDREAAERIKGSAALYNCGLRMNELCEELFARRPDILKDPDARERVVEVCQRYRWMSNREVDEAFARLPRFDPAKVPTVASDCGRPVEPPAGTNGYARASSSTSNGGPKVVLFCLDWSASMMSKDTGTQLSRFETCIDCVLRMLRDQVRDCDYVGVVGFGPTVQMVVAPTLKGQGGKLLVSQIASLRPQMAGGTCFFDAVAHCLRLLTQLSHVPADAQRFLVCLTDGDDLGSHPQNARGEMVTQLLANCASKYLNLLAVTVGPLKPVNVQVLRSWVQRVVTAGGVGRLFSERDAATIAKAFEIVAEYLVVEVGGTVEC